MDLLRTVEFTVERNHTNVTCVRKYFVSLQICTITWESTREINRTSVHCVTNVSAGWANCSDINILYTATEDSMSVLTAARCLRQTGTWNFMFVFTPMQSHIHADTVHSVLDGLTNSRHICWSHTMKVLGWHVTFVRRSSLQFIILNSIYFDMKVWRLMYVVSVQSLFVQMLNWNVISWYTRTTNSFVVVYVVKILSGKMMLYITLRNVSIRWDLVMLNLRDNVCLLLLAAWSFDDCFTHVLVVHIDTWNLCSLLFEIILLIIKLFWVNYYKLWYFWTVKL